MLRYTYRVDPWEEFRLLMELCKILGGYRFNMLNLEHLQPLRDEIEARLEELIKQGVNKNSV